MNTKRKEVVNDNPDSPDNDDDPDDPEFDLDGIEGEAAMAHMARMGLTIYRAVIRDGGTSNEAFVVTAAWFAGMSKGASE